MKETERVAELLREAVAIQKASFGEATPTFETVAGYLCANGVSVLPCKVGDVVWAANKTRKQVFRNVVHGIYIAGKNKHENILRLEYTNTIGEKSYRKFNFGQIGKVLFFTEEEARQVLNDMEGIDD